MPGVAPRLRPRLLPRHVLHLLEVLRDQPSEPAPRPWALVGAARGRSAADDHYRRLRLRRGVQCQLIHAPESVAATGRRAGSPDAQPNLHAIRPGASGVKIDRSVAVTVATPSRKVDGPTVPAGTMAKNHCSWRNRTACSRARRTPSRRWRPIRRQDGDPALVELLHPGPPGRRADLRLGRAPAGRDGRRGHAGDRHLRRAGHRPRLLPEAPERHLEPRPAGLLALDQRQRGALPPQDLLEGRHRRPRRRRRRQHPRRQRDLRPGEPAGRLPGRRRPRLQGQHRHARDEGLLQRRPAQDAARDHRQGRVHDPSGHQGHRRRSSPARR